MSESAHSSSEPVFDPSTSSIDRLIEQYWPLVVSVCRTQLADAHEAEDAAQETFIKLMNHREAITGNVAAWLTRVARNTSIDHVRRAIRRRQRHERLASQAPSEAAAPQQAARHAVRHLIPSALLELSPAEAEVLTLRFMEQQPLRVLALRFGVSAATLSRRVAQAVDNLSVVLEDMGAVGAGELDLSLYLNELTAANNHPDTPLGEWANDYHRDAGLHYHHARPPSFESSRPVGGRPPFPGWQRSMRVGVMLSHANHMYFTGLTNASVAFQAYATGRLNHPGVELISIVEPRTNEYGIIESTMREMELHDGLIEVTDTAGLSTLDVIIVGQHFIMDRRFLRPILDVVRGGVGLYHEGHATGQALDGPENADRYTFMLAEPPVDTTCPGKNQPDISKHNLPLPGTVVNTHPAVPWLRAGQAITLFSCAMVFKPVSGTTTIAVRDKPLRGHYGRMPPCKPPAVLAGQIGRGRVLMNHTLVAEPIYGEGEIASERFVQTLAWLGEPRREALDHHR